MDNNNIDFDGFASEKDIKDLQDSVKTTLTDFKNNCDKKYADINHTHNNYIEKINETKDVLVKEIDGYKGMITEDGNETRAIRTTKEGLIPYERGISSSLGSEEYRFDKAYVNKADINEVNSLVLRYFLSLDNSIVFRYINAVISATSIRLPFQSINEHIRIR